MSRHYLNVPYAQKDAAKALGARFDGAVKRWYVEAGRDLAPFARWVPEALAGVVAEVGRSAPEALGSGLVLEPVNGKGVALSVLLSGVANAVAQAFAQGVWTLVEVVAARVQGHVYLELSERDSGGQPIAKARAVIWKSTADRILPSFQRDTGVEVGAGIKLLVRARPVFHTQFGFSLEIDAIDSEYTLGDLEARKREIRERLQREGVFEQNRRLAAPWDFQHVLVVAPQEGAGLGDFRKEAERLARYGICRFDYVYSRFQGEGAARQITSALADALSQYAKGEQPDAVVIIRGGGAVNDLAWLNDYDLTRFICDLDIPVLTGIGHERDSTLPDEVAHTRFDTPSKVIAAIESRIVSRVQEAKAAAEMVFGAAVADVQQAKADAERLQEQIRADAVLQLSWARQDSAQAMRTVEVGGLRLLHSATVQSVGLLSQVQQSARQHLSVAQRQVPALLQDVQMHARQTLSAARHATHLSWQSVLEQGRSASRAARQASADRLQQVAERAQGHLQTARVQAEALMREVSGQGPEKTLGRGFAIVRDHEGKPLTSQQQASQQATLHIEFRDGSLPVRTDTVS